MREKRDGREEGWVGFPTRGRSPRGTPCAVGGVNNGQKEEGEGNAESQQTGAAEGLWRGQGPMDKQGLELGRNA